MGAEGAAGDGGVVEGGLRVVGGDRIADGERGFGVDCAAVDEDFGAEVACEDAFGFGQVDGSDVAAFRDH